MTTRLQSLLRRFTTRDQSFSSGNGYGPYDGRRPVSQYGDARARTVHAFDARLPSSLPGAFFQARIESIWPAVRRGVLSGVRATVESHLRSLAACASESHSLLDPGGAQTDVNLALNRSLWIPDAEIELVSAEVTLLPEASGRELAEQHEALQRESVLAEAAEEAKLGRLRLLGERVLVNPALARVWWLDGDPARLEKMVTMQHVFEKAAQLIASGQAARHGAGEDPAFAITNLIQAFISGLGPEHRLYLVGQLAKVFSSHERTDLAQELAATDWASLWMTGGDSTGSTTFKAEVAGAEVA